MPHSTHPPVAAVPQTCLAASAALHDHDRYTVVAHYGSVPGEIAVCMKSVGLADRSDYGVLELRGDRELLDRALSARLGDPPLAIGTGRRLRSVWYLRLDARQTLLVGPHAALASGPRSGADVTAATCRTATSAHRWRSSASSAHAPRDCSPPRTCRASCRSVRSAATPATATSSRSCARVSAAISRWSAPARQTRSGRAC